MSEEKSPFDRLLARPEFKPFSGRHAFRVLYMAKRKLKMQPVQEGDILEAVSSLGVMLETEVAMIGSPAEPLPALWGLLHEEGADQVQEGGASGRRRTELAKLAGMSPAERMRALTEGYARSIIEEKKKE
jgi:hypothetical protein